MNRKFNREKYLEAFTVMGEGSNKLCATEAQATLRNSLKYMVGCLRLVRRNSDRIEIFKDKHLTAAAFAQMECDLTGAIRHLYGLRRLAYKDARR